MARFIGRNSANFCELTGQAGRVSTVAVAFSEVNSSIVRWELAIDATTQERGTVRVGRIVTVPPSWFDGAPGAVEKRASTRVVALASCADATSWKVTGRPLVSADGDDAQLVSAISDCTLTAINIPIQSQGVMPVNADAIGIERPAGEAHQIVLAAGAPTLLVPYDADRARLVIAAATAADLAINYTGGNAVGDYFSIPAGQQFQTTSHRPVFAISVAGVTATFWTERY